MNCAGKILLPRQFLNFSYICLVIEWKSIAKGSKVYLHSHCNLWHYFSTYHFHQNIPQLEFGNESPSGYRCNARFTLRNWKLGVVFFTICNKCDSSLSLYDHKDPMEYIGPSASPSCDCDTWHKQRNYDGTNFFVNVHWKCFPLLTFQSIKYCSCTKGGNELGLISGFRFRAQQMLWCIRWHWLSNLEL